jgi:hypothetical protein
MKKRILTIALVALLMVGVSLGTWAIATSNYGTSSDPLITLSYLNETLMPQILADFKSEMDKKVGELTVEFEAQIKELEDRLAQHSGGDVFVTLTLRAGQSLTCGEGAEIMLRSGTVEAWSELSDLTSGDKLQPSGTLIKNHMYVVVSAGGGIGANSDAVILIRGAYTVN